MGEEEGRNRGPVRNPDFGLPGMFLPSSHRIEVGVGVGVAGGGAGRSVDPGYRFGVAAGSELGGSSGSGLVGAAATASVPASSPSPPPAVSGFILPSRSESGCGV